MKRSKRDARGKESAHSQDASVSGAKVGTSYRLTEYINV
jgi:hypothetical protein